MNATTVVTSFATTFWTDVPDRYALSVCTVGIIVGVDRIGDWLVVSAFDVV